MIILIISHNQSLIFTELNTELEYFFHSSYLTWSNLNLNSKFSYKNVYIYHWILLFYISYIKLYVKKWNKAIFDTKIIKIEIRIESIFILVLVFVIFVYKINNNDKEESQIL